MKKSCLLVAALIVTLFSYAQNRDQVKWSFTSKKINSNTYEVRMSAKLEKGWQIYSQSTPKPVTEESCGHEGCTHCASGPVPTSISFTKNPLVKLEGAAKEVGKLETRFDSKLDLDVKQFSNQIDFVQTVTVDPKAKTSLSGNVKYVACNDQKSLPPTMQTFTIELK